MQRARFVGAGAYSGARDPRQHGARARGTCSCSARQRPAHPNGPTLSELKTASRTLALERKRPVKPTELFELFKEFKVGVPKLGNVPTQTVHRMHVPFDRYSQALRIYVKRHRGSRDTHGTHTRDTRAHTGTRITQTNHPNPPTHPHARPHDDRNRGRLNSRSPVYMYKPPCWCRKFRCNSTPGSRLRARVTHPSAALREVAEQRHGKGAHGLVQLALHLRKA